MHGTTDEEVRSAAHVYHCSPNNNQVQKSIGFRVALDAVAIKPSQLHQRQSFSCTIVELVINMTYIASCCFSESYS